MAVEAADPLQHLGVLQNASPPLQTALFLGAMVLLPSLLVCLTGFTRIIIVLSLLRQAIGTPTTPPNQVMVGLALIPAMGSTGAAMSVALGEAAIWMPLRRAAEPAPQSEESPLPATAG